MKTGSETWKTNFEVTSTNTSLIIFTFLAKYPTAIIRNTGATILAEKIMLSNNSKVLKTYALSDSINSLNFSGTGTSLLVL